MFRTLTIARALPWLAAIAAAVFAAGAGAGWLAHGKWNQAAESTAWEARAHGLANDWRAANDDLIARLDERDARVAAFHGRETRINTALNGVLEEIEHAPDTDRSPWGPDRSVRLNRSFRALDAAAGPAEAAPGGP